VRHRSLPRPETWVPAAFVAVIALLATAFAWIMNNASYDAFASVLVLIALVTLSIPLLRAAGRRETDERIARVLWIAFGLKLLAGMARYIVAFDVYDGSADANMYHQWGTQIAAQLRSGDLALDLGGPIQGTAFIRGLTGYVYALTGPTSLGGFFVFAWFGFWGLYLFHRAFVRAVPDGNHRRYAFLVMLLPSLLFWPSSIGKEAWMCLGLGLAANGVARLLTRGRGGLLLIGAGMTALLLVRPHVAAIAAMAAFPAYLARRSPDRISAFAPVAKAAGILVMAVVLVVSVRQLESFFGIDSFDRDAVETTLEDVQDRTGQGGSFVRESGDTNLTLSRFPQAFLNVLFRPFPWQVTNALSAVAGLEAMFLLGLLVWSWRNVLTAARSLLRRPYVLFCAIYTVLFVFGFSSFANNGILVRQRVQVLPFVLVAMCLPTRGSDDDPFGGDDDDLGEVGSRQADGELVLTGPLWDRR
jgi:hypothetical protein